jgi:hypothetical protein
MRPADPTCYAVFYFNQKSLLIKKVKLPFRIKFDSKIETQFKINVSDIISFTQEYINTISYKSAYDFVIAKGELSFKVRFWNNGNAADFDGVSKSKFRARSDDKTLWLSYDYQIGGSFIYVMVLFCLLLLVAIVFAGKSFMEIFPTIGLLYIVASTLIWIATFYKQKRLFKEIVGKLVTTFSPGN